MKKTTEEAKDSSKVNNSEKAKFDLIEEALLKNVMGGCDSTRGCDTCSTGGGDGGYSVNPTCYGSC